MKEREPQNQNRTKGKGDLSFRMLNKEEEIG